ncbi:PaaI family thioesterase [Terrabacter carboxydivorans]|uniref:PaaI family thioesterase n=1 Tax=Terrabacter carboxydivorans TaxID=619730 RepID=A0ABN3KP23_9MICO
MTTEESKAIEHMNSFPVYQLVGMRVTEMSGGRAEVVLDDIGERHFGGMEGHKAVHGGIIATLGDAAMSRALASSIGFDQPFATISLSVEYLRPLVGDRAAAHGRTIRHGRRLAFAEARVCDSEGRDCAVLHAAFALGLESATRTVQGAADEAE